MPENLRLRVDRMIWRGRALAREASGRVVIIRPGPLPGEEVLVRPVLVKRDFIEAECLDILTPSPLRRAHPCPLSADCGGCAFGVLRQRDQLDLKCGLVSAELTRGLRRLQTDIPEVAVLAGLPAWRYRQRAQVHVRSGRAHYMGQSSGRVVAVEDCLLWCRSLAQAMPDLCANLPDGRHVIAASPTGPVLAEGQRGLLDFPIPAYDLTLRLPAGSFFQANWKLNMRLIDLAVAQLTPYQRIADLYSGAGNFALPLARRGHAVLALEGAPEAVRSGQDAASRAKLRNIEFQRADLSSASGLAALAAFAPDALLLDPPRSGAGPTLSALTAISSLRRLVWVSCDIVNTCRDLAPFITAGFRLTGVHLADMFPQTWHAEVVLTLDRCTAVGGGGLSALLPQTPTT